MLTLTPLYSFPRLIKLNNFGQPVCQIHKHPNYKMNIVYIRHQPGDDQFSINFRFIYDTEVYRTDRVFNFTRNVSETASSCVERIRTNIEKDFIKQNRKATSKIQRKLKKDVANIAEEIPAIIENNQFQVINK